MSSVDIHYYAKYIKYKYKYKFLQNYLKEQLEGCGGKINSQEVYENCKKILQDNKKYPDEILDSLTKYFNKIFGKTEKEREKNTILHTDTATKQTEPITLNQFLNKLKPLDLILSPNRNTDYIFGDYFDHPSFYKICKLLVTDSLLQNGFYLILYLTLFKTRRNKNGSIYKEELLKKRPDDVYYQLDKDTVNTLIDKNKIALNMTDSEQSSPLIIALRKDRSHNNDSDNKQIIELLITDKNKDTPTNTGEYPLLVAINLSWPLDIIIKLITDKAKNTAINGVYPLHVAINKYSQYNTTEFDNIIKQLTTTENIKKPYI